MKYAEYDDETIEDAPVSASLRVLRQSEVAEDDEDAVSWSEVQRLLYERDWGPILRLPATEDDFFSGYRCDGAFDTHDFWRQHGGNVRRYNAAMSWAMFEKKNVLITLSMVLERLPKVEAYQVLKYVKRGVIDESMVIGDDMKAAVRRYRQLLAVKEKIGRIAEAKRRWRGRPSAESRGE